MGCRPLSQPARCATRQLLLVPRVIGCSIRGRQRGIDSAIEIGVKQPHASDADFHSELTDEAGPGGSVSVAQAALLLKISRRTVYTRIKEGRLRTIRTIGGSQRVLMSSLHAIGFRPQAFATSAATVAVALNRVMRG